MLLHLLSHAARTFALESLYPLPSRNFCATGDAAARPQNAVASATVTRCRGVHRFRGYLSPARQAQTGRRSHRETAGAFGGLPAFCHPCRAIVTLVDPVRGDQTDGALEGQPSTATLASARWRRGLALPDVAGWGRSTCAIVATARFGRMLAVSAGGGRPVHAFLIFCIRA